MTFCLSSMMSEAPCGSVDLEKEKKKKYMM